mmetsp:Transcript_35182/g.92248  ORF Transcript_35182/g.92248 Transcript_35182/m.92248 type:complete len:109 (+) Transcript_35182:160-486(+)
MSSSAATAGEGAEEALHVSEGSMAGGGQGKQRRRARGWGHGQLRDDACEAAHILKGVGQVAIVSSQTTSEAERGAPEAAVPRRCCAWSVVWALSRRCDERGVVGPQGA